MGIASVCECSHTISDHRERYYTQSDQHYRSECKVPNCECKRFKFDHKSYRPARHSNKPKVLKISNLGTNGKPYVFESK